MIEVFSSVGHLIQIWGGRFLNTLQSFNMSLKDQLIDAIGEGDNIKVSNLLERMDVSDVNEKAGQHKITALHAACEHKNDRALTLLLAVPGIDVNVKDTFGFTPLGDACVRNNLQAISKLLAAPGIDVNVQDLYAYTPLHLVCLRNTHKAVALLLATPAVHVNGRTISGWTPVMVAARFHCEETIKLLLHDHRVDLDIKDNNERSLEEIVALRGSRKEEKKFLDLIKEERMKRGNVCKKQNTESNEDSTGIVIENIERINKKIEDGKQTWMEVVEKQEFEREKLKRKHQEEKTEQELERERLVKRHQEEKTQQEKMFAREAEAKKQNMTNLTEVRNQLARDLEKIHDKGENYAASNNDDHDKLEAARGALECPICLESMKPPKRIWMCRRSHPICEACKILLNGKPCPTCKSGSVNLRAYMTEKMAEIVFKKSEV